MAVKVSITPNADHLLVKVAGEVRTVEDVVSYTTVFRPEAVRLGLRRVLLDYVDARFSLDYYDLREVAEIGVRKDFPQLGLRIAVVCRTEDLDRHRLFETIAANRSIVYRVFTAPDKALAWLLAS
ncbi:hypothetical protein BerOc1_02866 [Pseudodesulfovibrio hydrargyri]|uniref:STAS/SEC14 domain-containing protein n=1 Tax=Pseudodesulfovibrio hydrargyri TaxID=2125990 RepID=A0A1J5N5M7_9BACT|nr:hypothetical protein [Pseudodesulfovibrio hydrargyri]OIQ50923.1 hypothetical protein BerOc1_02866 [Pseudodesulfovibrio hydrargyri]